MCTNGGGSLFGEREISAYDIVMTPIPEVEIMNWIEASNDSENRICSRLLRAWAFTGYFNNPLRTGH